MTQLNERFGLTHLRQMDNADLQASEDREADFDRFVDDSLLPLMLRDAADAHAPCASSACSAGPRVAARQPRRPRCERYIEEAARLPRGARCECSTTTPAIRS